MIHVGVDLHQRFCYNVDHLVPPSGLVIHVGVDLHQRFCYMTALEARGKILQAGPVTNEKLALRRYFRQFRGKEVQVAVEACGFWPAFREVVEPEVKRLVLVHPQRVKAIASAKLKNDRVDSETLAHLLRRHETE